MDKINFENGMHLSKELMTFMQNAFTRPLGDILKSGGNLILWGVESDVDSELNSYISDGAVVIDGEILPFKKSYVAANWNGNCKIVEEKAPIGKKGGGVIPDSIVTRYVHIDNTGNIPFDSLNQRIDIKIKRHSTQWADISAVNGVSYNTNFGRRWRISECGKLRIQLGVSAIDDTQTGGERILANIGAITNKVVHIQAIDGNNLPIMLKIENGSIKITQDEIRGSGWAFPIYCDSEVEL